MKEKRKPYSAYLLRLWRTQEVREAWRVSLEDAETRELRGFASLEELFRFLNEQTAPSSAASGEAVTEIESPGVKKDIPKTNAQTNE